MIFSQKTINYPIKKQFLVAGVKVELIKVGPASVIGAKIFCNDDKKGLSIYKYMAREGMFNEDFINLK